MWRHFNTLLAFALTAVTLSAAVRAEDHPAGSLHIGAFSQSKLSDLIPPGWKTLHFSNIERHTAYFLHRDADHIVVKAYSEQAASALYRKVDINPKQYPLIHWRWKIDKLIHAADIHSKAGDDYPARLYVSFAYDEKRLSGWERLKVKFYRLLHGEAPPLAVINYVWDNKAPVDTIAANAYTPRVQMIVVESGSEKLGQWVSVRRNIYYDYLKAFGEPAGQITGIGLMTDTDNTGEIANSYFGDIHLEPAPTEM